VLGTEGIKWNFTKFLVGRDGQVRKRYAPNAARPKSCAPTSRRPWPKEPQHERVPADVEPYAGDPILSLNEAFQKDPRKDKVNLSIGIYFDDAGRIPVLDQRAAGRGADAGRRRRQALPAHRGLGRHAQRRCRALLFGADHPAVASRPRRHASRPWAPAAGCEVGADFSSRRWLPDSALWVSDPTWDNHRAMFEGSGRCR
jgi:aromatic-amino-acid transaminase